MFPHAVANVYAVMGHGACRLSSKPVEGKEDSDYTIAGTNHVAECKSLCDDNPDCVAIAIRNKETAGKSKQCQLWTTMPSSASGDKWSHCHRKQPPLGWVVLSLVSTDYVRSRKYLSAHDTICALASVIVCACS